MIAAALIAVNLAAAGAVAVLRQATLRRWSEQAAAHLSRRPRPGRVPFEAGENPETARVRVREPTAGVDATVRRTITYRDGSQRTEEFFHRYQPED